MKTYYSKSEEFAGMIHLTQQKDVAGETDMD